MSSLAHNIVQKTCFEKKDEFCTHSIQAGLSAGEREGEAQRKTSILHAHVVQEVTDTLHNVIKQLEKEMYHNR